MPVDFSVTNQLSSPAIYASSFATRPAASFKGRLFVDTNVPSTGIYRDTGTAWVAIAGTGVAETQSLNDVCTVGNTTASLGIVIAGDSAIAAVPEEGFALTVGASGLSITTNADCKINELNIGRGGGNLIENTAIGYQALNNNSGDGLNNTAVGNKASYFNYEGDNTVAIGYQALYNNVEGNGNVAVGSNTLYACETGGNNTAIGTEALDALTEGNNNIGIGHNAGNVTIGVRNIFIGVNTALNHPDDNENVVIGFGAIAPNGNNQFVIGTAGNNVGSVTNEVNASTKVWNVTINGVNRKILLA
jgi:hypothetical protein